MLLEALRGENDFECTQQQPDRGRRVFGPDVDRKGGGYELVAAVGVLGDGEQVVK